MNGVAKDGIRLVEVDSAEKLPPSQPAKSFQPLASLWSEEKERIAPGDVLSITLYEVGVKLFAAAPALSGGQSTSNAGAQGERLTGISVDNAGRIRLPYIGSIQAANLTPAELGQLIEERLIGKSEYPQVLVAKEQAVGSTVVISGEVADSGRIPLTNAHERLLDIIALAHGYRGNKNELTVKVTRGNNVSEGPLAALNYGNFGGTLMEPGDRIEILRSSRTISLLGAANRVSQIGFSEDTLSLAEALAQTGGPNENVANPGAVFVFRFESDAQGLEQPVVYHVNMTRPLSYLLAQKLLLNNKDVIYVAGAEANRPIKLLQIIGQIFTPVVLLQQLTK